MVKNTQTARNKDKMSKYLIVVVTTTQLTSKPGQRCANVLVEKSVPGGFRNLNLWFFCLIQLLLYKDHFHLLEITFLMTLIFGTKINRTITIQTLR